MCSLVSCGSEIGVPSSVYVLYSRVLHPLDLFLASHKVLGFILAFSCRLFSLSSIFFLFLPFQFQSGVPFDFSCRLLLLGPFVRGFLHCSFLELFFVVFNYISFFLYHMVGSSGLVCSDFSYSHCVPHYAFYFPFWLLGSCLFFFFCVGLFYSCIEFSPALLVVEFSFSWKDGLLGSLILTRIGIVLWSVSFLLLS